jgi:hypothetical protein
MAGGGIVKKGMLFAVIVALAMPAITTAQGRTRDEQRRRDQIRIMEGVLVQAVRLGAEDVGRQLERFEPAGVTVLSGVPRARGFVLEGYGVFFDVEIPDMNQSVIWSMMNVQRDRTIGNALDSLQAFITATQSPGRDQAESALQQISKTIGPPRPRSPQVAGQPAPGQVAATTAPMPDPDKLYSESVKAALVDAMLDHSLQMSLGPDEWLTVAARASEGPLPQAALSDLITIVMRVKGSDLSVYQADPSRRDEIRERVKTEARVF